jgi:hypothetical protein
MNSHTDLDRVVQVHGIEIQSDFALRQRARVTGSAALLACPADLDRDQCETEEQSHRKA